ncbi:MAG TPA: hypothetical protein VM573_07560 [Actinomycetota bacterium]|jgi:hypothetical protein|nr:hypothetical protein [Actinomycetota bacterium]
MKGGSGLTLPLTEPYESWGSDLTGLFLGLLALAWLCVFAPAVLRARRETPFRSSERFRASLETIRPSGARYMILPEGDRRPATSYRRALLERRRIARRRRVFNLLLGLSALSALNALLSGPGGLTLHLFADAVLGVYVAYLIEARRRVAERVTKVHRISAPRREAFRFTEPVAVRRRA